MPQTINNVPRELLERLHSYIPNGDGHNSQYANDLADAVVALEGFAAQSPAGADGLEVRAYEDSGGALYTAKLLEIMEVDSVGCEPLCRLSDAQAIIDGLRGEVERLQRAEKNDAIAYKAVLERQDELRAELAAIKAQGVVMPELIEKLRAIAIRERMFRIEETYTVPEISDSISLLNNEMDEVARLNAAPVQHPDDAAVDRFAVAMKAKLAASREKGRHGWQNATAPHLSSLLHEHMYKGDPLDVGNLAMMLHQNGQAIELPHDARRVTTSAQQVSVPGGWKWVPVDPTGAMLGAAFDGTGESEAMRARVNLRFLNAYRAMLAAAPAAPEADAGLVDMYRHLQTVTPYRFKKIQDASVTDGGDVLYFHKDRFDAALLDDMAANCAKESK